jgi:hypothetical protein
MFVSRRRGHSVTYATLPATLSPTVCALAVLAGLHPGRVAASARLTVPLARSGFQLPAATHTVTARARSGEPGAAGHQRFGTVRLGR